MRASREALSSLFPSTRSAHNCNYAFAYCLPPLSHCRANTSLPLPPARCLRPVSRPCHPGPQSLTRPPSSSPSSPSRAGSRAQSVVVMLDWFWSDGVWVYPGYTWQDIARLSGVTLSDLRWSFVTAVFMIAIRSMIEKLILTPIGTYYGLKDRSSAAYQKRKSPSLISSDLRLEQAWSRSKKDLLAFDQKVLQSLLKSLGNELSQRQLERWIRRRANCERSSRMSRFTESAWRMIFYAFAFAFGIFTLWDKEWFTDSVHCFDNYPHHAVGWKEWWYYNIEMGFYLSLLYSQFTDVPKKDFYQMLVHHIVTILLLTFSWTVNFVRIGTLVLVIHDFADIPLEGAKICRYLMFPDGISNSVFGVFTLSWIFSRLGLLPYRVIAYSCYWGLILPDRPVKFFPVYYIFNALLIALQVLHVIWTVLILRVAYNAFYVDGVKDLREDSSFSSSQSADDEDLDAEGDKMTDGLILSSGDGSVVAMKRKHAANGSATAVHD